MTPFSLWILMIVVVVLASLGTQSNSVMLSTGHYYERKESPMFLFFIVVLLMVFFSANTIANDVMNYRSHFIWDSYTKPLSEYFANGVGSNPIFMILQSVVKNYISSDPAVLQLVCASITQPLFLLFYRKYSPSLPMSLFMFIASGLFFFTMVSWKQSMAMGIGLTLIPLAIKKKWLYFYCTLFITMLIHPYVLMYGILPFLINDKVWTKKNTLIIATMAAAGYALSSILGAALDFTENVFGDRHGAEWFDTEHGVSLPRIIFFSITPILSWIFRKSLDEHPYPLMNGFIQMSVVSFGFYLMSLSGGANFISRMGTYFEPYTYVALPYILTKVIPKEKRVLYTTTVIIMFLTFFSFLQLKQGSLF